MAKEILTIKIEVESNVDAYKIITTLANELPGKILLVVYKEKNWIFKDPKKIKYFLKNDYFDFEKNQEIKVKEL